MRHLACFVAVAQERTLARAAQRLHVSQPAVSKTLSELERMAGRRLVDRGRNGTQLTPAGEQFLPVATEATRAVQAAAGALSPRSAVPSPVLPVGALHTTAGGLLARAIARLLARRPDARVAVRASHNPELLSALTSGEIDLAVGRMAEPAMMRGISFELLYAESMAVVTRPGHPLAGGAAVSPPDLLGFPLVIPEAGTAPRMAAEAIVGPGGIALAAGCTETQSATVARGLALACDAIWIAPRHAVQLDLDHGWLAAVDVPVPAAAEPIGILTRGSARPAALAQDLIAALRDLS